MQLLSCDLWLMEFGAFRAFKSLAESSVSADIDLVRASTPQPTKQKAVGIIPVTGVLAARHSLIGELLGMSSYERIGQMVDAFAADESISGIIMRICSPGGMVYGCEEAAEKIYRARSAKPVIAVADPLAASGGYWLAAAASRVVVTPSGDLGSVGVIHEHVDVSQANEQRGEKVTIVRSSAAPFKAQFNELEPLSEEGRQHLQARADEIHGRFAGALAKYRGVPVDHVNEHFGKGRVVDAQSAVRAGMADRVETFEQIVYKMAAGRIRIGAEKAQDVWDAPTRREMLREKAERIRVAAESMEGDAA